VKRAILFLIIGAAVGGVVVWSATRAGKPDADEAKPSEESEKPSITRDNEGNVVVGVSDEKQGAAGIVVTNPVSSAWSPELKGYGRVIDPAALSALITEFSSAQGAYAASSNELARLRLLAGQGNASPRAVQAAEATALHDQLAAQSSKERLTLSWGSSLAQQQNLQSFAESLANLDSALVRIDVSPDQSPEAMPASARIVTLTGKSIAADFSGVASASDAQVQGRGFFFYVRTNSIHLMPGDAVVGYLSVAGEPVKGVTVPRDAVVRTEGKAWIYVLNENGESFTRKEIALDHPVDSGWLVAAGLSSTNYIVITGAQTLLSEESKAAMSPD
jgi:hypothetical protein